MIEIEKKFILTKEKEDALMEGAEFLGEKEFTDIYYDDENFSLTTKDIWFRERAGRFELKISMNNNESTEDRISDRYRELEKEYEILEYFNSQDISMNDFLNKNEYLPFCKITTRRKKFKKDGFGIDMDIMDFGYSLVEIEVMVENESEMQKATESIIEFAKEHNIDTSAKILGKVIEYLRVKSPEHLRALIDSGVVKNV